MMTVAGLLAFLLALAGCGAGQEEGQPTPWPSPTPTPTATPRPGPDESAAPAGTIVFLREEDGNQEIYAMAADGSGQRNLSRHPANDLDPDLSPDGRRIAFVSQRNGDPYIFVMDADGANLRQLTSGEWSGISPRWSNDGQRIVFSRAGDLVVMDADGRNQRVILEAEPEETAAPCRAGAYPGSWTPDDSRISYYSASLSRGIAQLCSIGADGSNIKVLLAEPPAFYVEPMWSPDGRYIVYRAIVGGVHDIWVLDLDSGAQVNLTNDAAVDIEPDWSPGGQWIAYGKLESGAANFDIYIMRKDGSEQRRLTEGPARDSYPVWGP